MLRLLCSLENWSSLCADWGERPPAPRYPTLANNPRLDFIVAVEDSFQCVRQALLKQGFRHGKIPHRFYTPEGTQVDVLPVQERAIEKGFIEFPDGERLVALGFSEALTRAEKKLVAIAWYPSHCFRSW